MTKELLKARRAYERSLRRYYAAQDRHAKIVAASYQNVNRAQGAIYLAERRVRELEETERGIERSKRGNKTEGQGNG